VRSTCLGAGFLALVLVFAGTTGVEAQQVTYDYDRSVDFSKYTTYRWIQIEGAEPPDQITDKNIKSAVDATLKGKGLARTEADSAELLVGHQISVSQERQLNAYGAPGWRFGGAASVSTSTIEVGTLVLDFYDSASKTLVWRGRATKTLNPSKDPEKNQKRLQKAVDKLLASYPPGS
jgi:hypothetical protein